ncbi:hypothetical protein [Cedecea lapagei]|nr:hypothetical protein [Cedecea lapagei]
MFHEMGKSRPLIVFVQASSLYAYQRGGLTRIRLMIQSASEAVR